MNNRSSTLFILIRIVRMVEKCLLVLGLEKGWVVIRRLWSLDTLLIRWGETKLFYLI